MYTHMYIYILTYAFTYEDTYTYVFIKVYLDTQVHCRGVQIYKSVEGEERGEG